MKLFCGLISVILIVLRTVNLQFHNQFAFPWGQFSELWQLMSWLQSCHHVVNLSTWCFSIYQTARRIWLRILSIALVKELKVLLTVLNEYIIIIWFPLTVSFWFPLFLHFFHFSDWTYAQTKGRLKTWGGGGLVQTTGSCSILHWQRVSKNSK